MPGILNEAIRSFSEFLGKQDLKLTSQRKAILEETVRAKGHFSAEELLKLSKKRDNTISKATVYRTLSLLKDGKILEEHDFGDGRKHYEIALRRKHHDHFICVRCNRILEFENDAIERLQEEEAKKKDFKIVYHSLKLFGLCKACR